MNGISEINWDLCGSRRAFPRLGFFTLREMESLEVWYTTYPGDTDGVNEFMFPKLSNLEISDCPNLRLKPCPHGAWYLCSIQGRSDGVISSWDEGGSRTSSARISSLRRWLQVAHASVEAASPPPWPHYIKHQRMQ